MYTLVFFSCALTFALAGYSHHNNEWISQNTYDHGHQYNNHHEYNEHNKYHGPLHFPVINHHGVPVEPHAVQAARAQHLSAYAKESSHNSWIPHNTYNDHEQYNSHHEYNEHNKYHGPLHLPVINHHGVPVEPHAVQAARAQHLFVHSKASFSHGWVPHNTYGGYHQYKNQHEYNEHNKYHGPLHIPVINHHGVPVEPHAVQAARAQHLAAHNKGHGSYHGHYNYASEGNHYRRRRALDYNGYAQHAPVIGHHGVPADTPEVQAARAQHLAALSQASTHNSYNSYDNYNNDNSHNNYDSYNNDNSHDNYDNYNDDHQQNNQQEYNEHNKYHGPIHIPVIGPHGVPIEPKEVQAARAHHLSAYSDASVHNSWNSQDNYDNNNQYNGDQQNNNHQEYNQHNKYHGPIHIPVIGPHGVPVETPEVQAAKAEHLASYNKVGGVYQGAQYNAHYNPAAAGQHIYGSGAQGYNQHHY